MVRSAYFLFLLSFAAMAASSGHSVAAPAIQETPPPSPPPAPNDPEVVLPFDPTGTEHWACMMNPSCTILDFYNPNIPSIVEECIPVDTEGRDMSGRRHFGDTCRPVRDSEEQSDIRPNP